MLRAMTPNNLAEAQQYIIEDNNIRYLKTGNMEKHQIRTSHQNIHRTNFNHIIRPSLNHTTQSHQTQFSKGP